MAFSHNLGRLEPVSRLAQIDEIRTNSLGTAERRAPDARCAFWILSVPCWPARLSGIPHEVFLELGNIVTPDTHPDAGCMLQNAKNLTENPPRVPLAHESRSVYIKR